MDTNESNMGQVALKRKERLRQLRERAQKTENGAENNGSSKTPIFRSYKPQNETTLGEVLLQEPSGDIESAVEAQMDLLKKPMTIEEIDIGNLAPRKPDWDLKRDVAKKLERLERRTQKAIAELIRERLIKNQVSEDVFQAVNVGTAHAGEKSTEDFDD